MVLLVDQVRTLTTNFQRLLAQATKEIKKLTAEKVTITTIINDIIITRSEHHINRDHLDVCHYHHLYHRRLGWRESKRSC